MLGVGTTRPRKHSGSQTSAFSMQEVCKQIGRMRIVTVYVLLALVALVYATYVLYSYTRRGEPNTAHRGYGWKDAALHDRMPDTEISAYLAALVDTRPSRCIQTTYEEGNRPKVSIIVHFNDDEFYNAKLALQSIITHTPSKLYHELILLDDGSKKKPVAFHASNFLSRPEFKHVRKFRSEIAEGPSAARFKASKLATGSVLVFIGSEVVVNTGWLEPLLAAVRDDPTVLAASHTDNFLSDIRFFETANNYINMMTWTLSTVFLEASDSSSSLASTPVMKGHAFAVNKRFMESIGDYDDALHHGGGHDLELSLRAWMCGGSVKIARCSRVAVHNALKPRTVFSEVNIRRITELWLDGYKHYVYVQTGVARIMPDAESLSLKERRSVIQQSASCHPFSWYMHHVTGDIVVPTSNVRVFGKLRTRTGYCTRGVANDNQELDMVLCRPHMYDAALMFEMDKEGALLTRTRCVQPHAGSYVASLQVCVDDEPAQRWKHRDDGRLMNDAFPDMCLQHVTEYGHHAKLVPCTDDRLQEWAFIKF